MKKPVERSLGLLDVILLVVGVAFSLVLTRLYLAQDYAIFSARSKNLNSKYMYTIWVLHEVTEVVWLWLSGLFPIVLLIRFRRPRSTVARLLVQPGASASLAVALIVTIGSFFTAIAFGIDWSDLWFYYYFKAYFTQIFPCAGAAVIVAWVFQVAGRRWRPEAGAIDRIGRFMGACWVATFLVNTMCLLIEGAESSRNAGTNPSLFISEAQGAQNDSETYEAARKEWMEAIEHSRLHRAKLVALIEAGDKSSLIAELMDQVKSEAENEKWYLELLNKFK